ncbi:hypothetical protein LOZ07_002298 [Ophidiomyces ophidiicola]|nr:hypothetical protein LOZ60_005319 [Ophidiomyces ophidiicola]KAI2035672.1 hypothetical protein LOZ48_001215 [Ophidiomyces ophidiicola]KAI2095486.1 hypothetical protein LOZ33_004117 [Ophidiomyces ophidiicola]KAI2265597.1 hypothetical protein LOZ05_004654 [Ophidiomyces ophidiicola]KAI2299005.1 hypothetical protein LOZ07_002298 [Ophidiomyces ophidiicola]
MVSKSISLLSACLFGALTAANPQNPTEPTPTVSLWLPQFGDGEEKMSLGASVIAARPDITSYALCPLSVDQNVCQQSGITIAQGPKTYEMTNTIVDNNIANLNPSNGKNEVRCELFGTSSASCVASVSASASGSAEATMTSAVFSDPSNMVFVPVAITAGADKLKNIAAAAEPTGAGANAASANVSGGAAAASTGGAPKVTGTARWLMGGAAAMIVVAAL